MAAPDEIKEFVYGNDYTFNVPKGKKLHLYPQTEVEDEIVNSYTIFVTTGLVTKIYPFMDEEFSCELIPPRFNLHNVHEATIKLCARKEIGHEIKVDPGERFRLVVSPKPNSFYLIKRIEDEATQPNHLVIYEVRVHPGVCQTIYLNPGVGYQILGGGFDNNEGKIATPGEIEVISEGEPLTKTIPNHHVIDQVFRPEFGNNYEFTMRLSEEKHILCHESYPKPYQFYFVNVQIGGTYIMMFHQTEACVIKAFAAEDEEGVAIVQVLCRERKDTEKIFNLTSDTTITLILTPKNRFVFSTVDPGGSKDILDTANNVTVIPGQVKALSLIKNQQYIFSLDEKHYETLLYPGMITVSYTAEADSIGPEPVSVIIEPGVPVVEPQPVASSQSISMPSLFDMLKDL